MKKNIKDTISNEHRKKSVYHINDRESWFSANKIRCLCPDCEEVEQIAHDNLSEQIMADSMIVSNRIKIPCDCLECKQFILDQRKQSDKLWLYLSYGLGLFIVGYMLWHFIRFLMM